MKSVLLLAATLIALSVSMAHAVVYRGAMDNRAGYPFVPGFTAQTRAWVTGDTAGGGLRLEWQVDDESTPGSWTYSYRLLRGVDRNKGFAFFDFETAADFTSANIRVREVVSATDRFLATISAGLGSITISDPVNFNAVHDFSNAALSEASPATALNKGDLSHYSGDPGRVAPGVPGSPASATPSVGPVPHPFYGIRVIFPDDPTLDLAFQACEWEVRLVTDRTPMWGKVFGWGDQTVLSPYWYANFYNDGIDTPDRLTLPAADSLTGAAPYRGWVLVPGPLPGVLATTPADGSVAVPVTERVSALFGAVMDGSTIGSATFALSSNGGPGASGPVSGTVQYHPASNSATFHPDFPLAPGTTYTATIGTGARDLAGNPLPAPRSWSFTTAALDSVPPAVTATLPGPGAAYLATTTSLSASFSEQIDPATLTPENFGVAGVSGSVLYHAATRSATFTPDAPLAHNTSYTATIGTGVRDLAGNPLAAAVQWSVSTIPAETVLPFVLSTFPAARSANVVTTTTISATFSEPIEPASLTPSTFFVAGVSGSTSYDPASRTATFTPAAPLAGNTSYKLTVTTGIRDLAGNAVGLRKDFSFKTLNTLTPNFSASGTVTGPGGAPLAGVPLQVTLISQSGTAKQSVVSDAAGEYSANQLLSGQYLIVPSRPATIFTPPSRTVSIGSAAVSGLDFSAALLTLSADRGTPQEVGTPITLTAAVQGGGGPFEYRFRLVSGAGSSVLQDYSASSTLAWRPAATGVYDLEADVRSAGVSSVLASAKLSSYQITPATIPSGSVIINDGALVTRSPKVTLKITATPNVTQMQFSKDGVNFFPWEPLAPIRLLTLPAGDGLKTITARFRSGAGNTSIPISGHIILDTSKPTGSVTINGGATLTNRRGATLTLSATGPSPVTQMQLSKDGVNFFAWEPFASSRSVTLTPGDGLKSITVRFKDSAGIVSAPVAASITLETVKPTGTIAFSSPNPTTASTGTLALTASDASGVTQMQFSKNGGAFFAWEPFAATRNVTLPIIGVNTLTVRYRDAAGNVSDPFSATVTRNNP